MRHVDLVTLSLPPTPAAEGAEIPGLHGSHRGRALHVQDVRRLRQDTPDAKQQRGVSLPTRGERLRQRPQHQRGAQHSAALPYATLRHTVTALDARVMLGRVYFSLFLRVGRVCASYIFKS